MNIGIMGLGFVGGTTKKVFEKKHKVFSYDPNKKGYKDKEVLKKVEIIFICVPTPPTNNGKISLKYLHEALKIIKNLKINPIICIRSTIPPGSINSLEKKYSFNIGHNPEFLREKHALKDMLNTNRIIISGSQKVKKLIKKVYFPIFPKVKYVELTNKEAEMVKSAANCFLASQITFANEIHSMCKAHRINYNNVKNTILLDDRIGRNIDVPGPDGKFGFGGRCFPKDLKALIHSSREKGYRAYLTEEIWRSNQTRFRKKHG